MRNIIFGALLAVTVFHSAILEAQNNLLTNGSFETGDLTGWTVVNTGSGQFSVESGIVTPTSGGPIPAPPDGTYATVSDQGGPGSHILYQDVLVPNEGLVTLSFLLYYNNRAGAWADNGTLSEVGEANQQLRIDIMDPSAPVDDISFGVLRNVLKPVGDDPFILGYESFTEDLSTFAGQTVRIRFAEVDNQSNLNMAIDGVAVTAVAVQPYVPVPANMPLALLLLVLGLMGMAAFTIRKSQALH